MPCTEGRGLCRPKGQVGEREQELVQEKGLCFNAGKENKNSNSEGTGSAQASWAGRLASCLEGWCAHGRCPGSGLLGRIGKTDGSEVHGAVGQVVLAANVADLLGLHSFEFGAVGDPMAKASTEGTAPFSWG